MKIIDTITEKSRKERICIFAEKALGKSTLAASAPNNLFIRTEDSLNEIDAQSLELCLSYDQFMDQLKQVYKESHSFQSVTIDTCDWLQGLVYKKICQQNGVKAINDIPYAGGYKASLAEFNKIINALNIINIERDMRIIILCHSQIKQIKSPLTVDFDQYKLKLYDGNAELIEEWVDAIGFLHTRMYINTEDKGFGNNVSKGVGGSERIVSFAKSAAYKSGNRYNITEDIDIPIENGYAAIMNAIEEGRKSLRSKKPPTPIEKNKSIAK